MDHNAEPILSTSLKDQIYERIKAMIFDGTIKQGERILEPELAVMLNTSITPVREALNKLNGNGLLIKKGRNGTFVVEFTVDDVINLYDLRGVLESLAVRETAFHVDRTRILQLYEKMKAKEEKKNGYFETQQFYNTLFHSFFIENAHNPWLKDTMERLNDLLLLARVDLTRGTEGSGVSEKAHLVVLERLLQGEIPEAEEAMAAHIRETKNRVVKFMLNPLEDTERKK